MSDDELRKAARHNLKARNDFKVMVAIFIVITVMLVAIWFFSSGFTGTSYFWPIWPILGFIIATVFTGLDAYGITRRQITEADVDAEVQRMAAKRNAGGPSDGGSAEA